MTSVPTGAGWVRDPWGTHEFRYWDGYQWTEHVSDRGRLSVAVVSSAGHGQPNMSLTRVQRSKSTALLLAGFLSFWTWTYTYKLDARKFWFGLVCVGILGVVAAVLRSPASLVFYLAGSAAVWCWSVADAVLRSDDWYLSYPYGDTVMSQRRLGRRAQSRPPIPPDADDPVPQVTSTASTAESPKHLF